ncbi:MAG: hypothetical protein LBC56_02180 [Oscillospiraceae bacterium]|nr:hypothetical protein [Oscillospiraceae bacterium]
MDRVSGAVSVSSAEISAGSSEETSSESFPESGEEKISSQNDALESAYIDLTKTTGIKYIDVGGSTICTILDDGSIVLWGTNYNGTVGNGKKYEYIQDDGKMVPNSSPPFRNAFSSKIVDVASDICSYALSENGELYMWGFNYHSTIPLPFDYMLYPQKIKDVQNVKSVALSTGLCLILDDSGNVYHTGIMIEKFKSPYEYFSAFDFGELEVHEKFTKIYLDFKCANIYASPIAYIFLSTEGEVYIQGMIDCSKASGEDNFYFAEPSKLDFPEKITDVAASAFGIMALSETGGVYIYGTSDEGLINETLDTKISENIYKKNLDKVKQISANGDNPFAALTENGEVYVWGRDSHGISEYPSETYVLLDEGKMISVPVKLDLKNIAQISISEFVGTAIDADGNVFIWGDNSTNEHIEFK